MLSGNAMRILWTFEPLSNTQQHSQKSNKDSSQNSFFSFFMNQINKPEKTTPIKRKRAKVGSRTFRNQLREAEERNLEQNQRQAR